MDHTYMIILCLIFTTHSNCFCCLLFESGLKQAQWQMDKKYKNKIKWQLSLSFHRNNAILFFSLTERSRQCNFHQNIDVKQSRSMLMVASWRHTSSISFHFPLGFMILISLVSSQKMYFHIHKYCQILNIYFNAKYHLKKHCLQTIFQKLSGLLFYYFL